MTNLQIPVHSGFSAASTADDVISGISLEGKNAIVTGGYAGIGFETVRVLSAAGARVTVPARHADSARQALQGLPNTDIEIIDLMDPASIDAFAARYLATGRPLHILVNNAGVMASPLLRDARGYESQLATNHLGHYQLTVRLWPALLQAQGARVVTVSSWGHRRTQVNFEDPNYLHRPYDRLEAYGQSKTANILFTVALDKRGAPHGVRAFALHPGGIVSTNLKRYFTDDELRAGGLIDEAGHAIIDPDKSMKTIAQGAATTVWCATSPQLESMGGLYCENSDIAPLVPEAMEINGQLGALPMGVMRYATDPDAAEKLWKMSVEMTGVGL